MTQVNRGFHDVFFRKIWREYRKTDTTAGSEIDSGPGKRIDYIKLEDRRVLNATFAFDMMTGQLTLDNFTDDFVGDNQLNIAQFNDQYLFTLSDGIWTSIDGVGSIGDGSNVLAVDVGLVSRIDVISNTADQFGIEFSNFAFVGDVNIFQEAGFEVFSTVTQQLGSQLSQVGTLNIAGVQSIDLQNLTNDFDRIDISSVSQARITDVTSIIVDRAVVESTLSIQADGIIVEGEISSDSVLLNSTAGVSQTTVGTIAAGNLLLGGTGSFDLDAAEHQVDNLAASINGSLSFANNGDIHFANLTLDSLQIVGVSIAGDLDLNVSADNGSIIQSAAVQVSGTTRLDAGTGDICLTGSDNNADNDFNTLLIVSATSAEIVDANDLNLLSANVTNQLWLAAGDADLDLTDGIGGTLTIAGDITAGNQVLLQASAGVQQLAGVIGTTQLLLGGDDVKEGAGTFDLRQNNNVRELAARLNGDLTFVSSANLSIVAAAFDSECDDPIANPLSESFAGIVTNNRPVKLDVGADLLINAQLNVGASNILLVVDQNVGQTDSGIVSAGGLGLMVSGSTVLNEANDVTTLAANNGGTTIFNDVNRINIGAVSIAIGSGPEMVVTGISTADSDLKITADGDVLIVRAIVSGDGVAFFDVNGSLNQSVNGTVTANGLALMVNGSTLLNANNDVNVIAADNDSLTVFRDVDGLTVGTVTVAAGTAFEMSLAGITTSNDDAKLTTGGNLTLNQSINTGSGNTFLTVGGNLNQAAAGTITANGLGLMVSGSTLLNANNDVHVIAADNDGLIVFRDVDGLIVGTVTVAAGTAFEISLAGITTSNDDAKLIAGGNLTLNQSINTGSGNTFLTVGGNLNQAAAGTITANGLGLMVSGSTLLNANNDVNVIAADNDGLTVFRDVDGLIVGTVTVAAGTAFEMSLVGIETSNDDVKLVVGGDLEIDDAIQIGFANLLLVVNGNLTQTIIDADGSPGTIDTGGLALMVDGSTSLLNPANSIDRLAADNIGSLSFRNDGDLTISRITVDGMEINGATLRSHFFAEIDGSIRQSAAIVVHGTTNLMASGEICLSGADSTGDGVNDNDFVGVVTAAASGSSLEISDSNQLRVGNLLATDNIWLRSGDGADGSLILTNSIVTSAAGGQVLLQSDRGVTQSTGNSYITTDNLLLGSSSIADARRGDFVLLGNNVVKNIAGELDNTLEFTNRRDLNIAPLSYDSVCSDVVESFRGLKVGSVVLNVTAGDLSLGNLSDSLDAETVVDSVAQLNVAANIVLGDGAATLQFTDHSIDKLLSQNVSDAFVQISATGNRGNVDGTDIVATANVSLFVDSTVILSDVNVVGTLFIDTIEGIPANGSAGDILQTMIADDSASTIVAESAAFISNASLQLTNTMFDRLAIEANQQVSQLIRPFVLNANIGSTFTGSIDANVFADPDADQFLNGGDPANPVDGVFDVEAGFLNDGFFAGNNQFLNPNRVGAVVVNGKALDVVSFDALGLTGLQMADVENGSAAATSLGDIYLETVAAANLDISANLAVTSGRSNITVVAGGDLELNGNAELRRSEGSDLIGLVNTLQFEFPFDQFLLTDPRSVLVAPGNIAFSDLNAQLDSAIGFQNFEFFFGNSGQRSFNLIVGWFVDGVSSSDALNALFQQSLLQGNSDLTADFLLSNFGNFGQGVSAFALQLDSQLAGSDAALSLTNTSPFQQSFFAERSFLLSQIFLTNDARINVFADGGRTDLNFTQEILPTRTVVQNPNFIIVDTPRFEVPEPPATAQPVPFIFVDLIQNPESVPITTEQQPESYFLIKYTADDDGIFEESFKWDDANDDPDAIRAAIEDAKLNDDDDFWPETDGENKGDWFAKIKEGNQIKPGLYFIFEVQEGEELSEPVDAPIDRTDIENLIQPDSELERRDSPQSQFDSSFNIGETESSPLNDQLPIDESSSLLSEPRFQSDSGAYRFSDATRSAAMGSSLLLAQYLLARGTSSDRMSNGSSHSAVVSGNMFSRAARFARKLGNSMPDRMD